MGPAGRGEGNETASKDDAYAKMEDECRPRPRRRTQGEVKSVQAGGETAENSVYVQVTHPHEPIAVIRPLLTYSWVRW